MKLKSVSEFGEEEADDLVIGVGKLSIGEKPRNFAGDEKPTNEPTSSENCGRKSNLDVDRSLLIAKGPSRTSTSLEVRNLSRPYLSVLHQNVSQSSANRKLQTNDVKAVENSWYWNDYSTCYEARSFNEHENISVEDIELCKDIPLPVEDLANRLVSSDQPCDGNDHDENDLNRLMDAALNLLGDYQLTGTLIPTSPSCYDSADNSDGTSQFSPASQCSPWTSPEPELAQSVSPDIWKEMDFNSPQGAIYVGSDVPSCGDFSSNLIELQPSKNINDNYNDLRLVPVANGFSSDASNDSPSLHSYLTKESDDRYLNICHRIKPNLPLDEEQSPSSYSVPTPLDSHHSMQNERLPSPPIGVECGLARTPEYLNFSEVLNQFTTTPALNIPNLPSTTEPLNLNLDYTSNNDCVSQRLKPNVKNDPLKQIAPLKSSKMLNNPCRKSKSSSCFSSPSKRIQDMLKPQPKMATWMSVSLEPWNKFSKKNKDGQTKLMQILLCKPKPNAALEWVYSIAQRMKNEKERGAELLTAKDKNGHNALYQAAVLHPDVPELAAYIAEVYSALGCNVNEKFLYDNTLLHCLAALGESHEMVLRELLQLSVNGERLFNVNDRNSEGDTPLHKAAQSHCKENSTFNLADIFMKKGADVMSQNNRGETPLHVAATNSACEPSFFKKLLENPGAVNIQDNNGNTALHLLVFNVSLSNVQNMKKIMDQLLKNGGRIDVRNKDGRLPNSYIHQDHRQVFNFLYPSKK